MNYDYVKPWVDGIEPYTPGEMIEGCIKLASNENNYGPSPRVLDAIKKAAYSVNKYPYRDIEVIGRIASYCKVKSDNLILGNGSDELIDLILKTFRGPSLGFNPTFAYYKIASNILNEQYIQSNLDIDFSPRMEDIIAKSRKANILFLCNPNNPTGSVLSESEIKEILDEGKITVIDEAYSEFYGKTAISLLRDFDNLIIIRTFAKAFALAGLRIGYAVANQGVISLLGRVKPPFNVNSLSQEAAIAALSDIPYMKSTVDKIVGDRETIYKKLSERFNTFKSHGNFILIDTTPMDSDRFYEKLLKQGIIVRNLKKFKGFPGEYCRITIGTERENKKLIKALDEI